SVHFDRALTFANRPGDYLRDRFAWGQPTFDGTVLLQAFAFLLDRLGLPATYFPPSGSTPARLDAFALDLSTDRTTSPPRLRAEVFLPIGGNVDVDLPSPLPSWTFHAHFDGELDLGVTATIAPPLTIEITPPSGQVQGAAKLTIHGHPDSPFILLGQAGASR